MQLNNNTILPYPCLNLNIADENDIPNIDFEITHRNLVETVFRVKTLVTNEEIAELIKKGKAKYCLEMDCKTAFYRDAILNSEGDFTVALINNRFNGKLHSTLSVVAVEEIHDYKNHSFDSFYNNFTINIGLGETIAYIGSIDIDMEERSLNVKNIADDFIEVVCDKNLQFSRFDLGGSKILLKLPESLFESYSNPRINENTQLESFFHASFLLNVLTNALQNLGKYRNSKWAETLHDRIETEENLRKIVLGQEQEGEIFNENGDLINPDMALDLAQCILANPYERMFESFDNLNNEYDD